MEPISLRDILRKHDVNKVHVRYNLKYGENVFVGLGVTMHYVGFNYKDTFISIGFKPCHIVVTGREDSQSLRLEYKDIVDEMIKSNIKLDVIKSKVLFGVNRNNILEIEINHLDKSLVDIFNKIKESHYFDSKEFVYEYI